MKAASFSEMSVHMYQMTQCHIPEDSNLHFLCLNFASVLINHSQNVIPHKSVGTATAL
jgi:hypothetical protein